MRKSGEIGIIPSPIASRRILTFPHSRANTSVKEYARGIDNPQREDSAALGCFASASAPELDLSTREAARGGG